VKRVLFTVLMCTMFVLGFTGCGLFTQPVLGTNWNAKGASTITTAQDPLAAQAYALEVNLEFGGIWDPNAVKTGTVKFGAVSSEQRIDVADPEYNIVSGSYNKDTKILEINCVEVSNQSKIILNGTVTDKTTITSGTITGSTSQIGVFTINKQ